MAGAMTLLPTVVGVFSPFGWLETQPESALDQYLLSAVAIAAFLLAVGLASGVGRLLRDRISQDAVQAVEWVLITVVSVSFGAVLVAIWGITSDVEMALAPLAITGQTIVRALVTFIALAGAYSATRLSKRSIKYGAGRDYISDHQREVAHHLVQVLLFIPVLGFVVTLWEIPVRNLFIGAGALGIIVGFAARQTLSGALSGFVILVARPFEVGDWVSLHEHQGIVTDITLYNTRIRTFDEEHVLVPNDSITGNEVINYTETDRLRLTTEVNVDFDTDLDHAANVARRALESVDDIADTPDPSVVRSKFDDSSVVLELRYWINHPSINRKWLAQDAVITTVKSAFDEENIEIPFPQRTITRRDTSSMTRDETTQPAGDRGQDHRRERRQDRDREQDRSSPEGAPSGPSGTGGGD
jgi:Small-conductance mechanosensitive channel